MRQIENLYELFIEQLKEQRSGERLQSEALPKLRARTVNVGIKKLIDHHIGKTRNQVERLDRLFDILKRNYHGSENAGIEGLVSEALGLANRCTEGVTRDAGIITSVQHLNHYNIASYRTLQLYAESLNMLYEQELLKKSLEEELETDKKLFGVARIQLNLNESYNKNKS